jgi:hypothetical protein
MRSWRNRQTRTFEGRVGYPVVVQVHSIAPYVPVAQLDRAFDYESKGREFESLRARQMNWGYSSVGRAPALQAGGQRFESAYLHQLFLDSSAVEHPAVNRRVVGSNPTRGAIWSCGVEA